MTKRIAIYARCSTADDQTTENQIHELRARGGSRRTDFVCTSRDAAGVKPWRATGA